MIEAKIFQEDIDADWHRVHQYKFVTDNTDFWCPVCFCCMDWAYTRNGCGHSFCSTCAELERCPICRSIYTGKTCNLLLRQQMSQARAVCNACGTYGTLEFVKEHECVNALFECGLQDKCQARVDNDHKLDHRFVRYSFIAHPSCCHVIIHHNPFTVSQATVCARAKSLCLWCCFPRQGYPH